MSLSPVETHYNPLADEVVVEVSGEIDFTVTPLLLEKIEDAAEQSSTRFVLDLRAATYIDSGGLSVLFAADKRLKTSGRTLSVYVAPGSQPDRVLILGRFGNVLDISSGPAADPL